MKIQFKESLALSQGANRYTAEPSVSASRLSIRRATRRAGQTAVEYVLLIALSMVIFGAIFGALRKTLYILWMCRITPRVESPIPCDDKVSQCRASTSAADSSYGAPPACKD